LLEVNLLPNGRIVWVCRGPKQSAEITPARCYLALEGLHGAGAPHEGRVASMRNLVDDGAVRRAEEAFHRGMKKLYNRAHPGAAGTVQYSTRYTVLFNTVFIYAVHAVYSIPVVSLESNLTWKATKVRKFPLFQI
jgi:hypothetical protein